MAGAVGCRKHLITLEMGFPNKILPHYTYADYLLWKGQWELIDGIPYAMSPMPRPEHQRIAGNLHAELRSALKESKCDCTVYQPIDYKIEEDTVLNPDLLIVCKPITKQFLDFAPEVVVEILSPSTALKDRHTKYEIY
jgi:Uma2 family endonuclease